MRLICQVSLKALTLVEDAAMKHLFISHSSRKLLHGCVRKFWMQKFLQHPKYETGLAAEVGKALHLGFQHYIVHKDEAAAIWEYMKAYPIELCYDDMDDRSLEAGYYTLMEIIACSISSQMEVAQIVCLDGVTRPAIEVPFEIVLEGIDLDGNGMGISYIGYIDAIMWDPIDEEYCVLDLKTSGRKLTDVDPLYKFSEQVIPYSMVLEYMQNSGVSQFTAKYVHAKIDILAPNVQTLPYVKDAHAVQEWYQGLLVDVAAIQQYIRMNFWPRTGGGDGCMSWNRPCKFFDICGINDHDMLRNIVEDATRELAQDEATYSKTLRPQFEPWVRFNLLAGAEK